ncbi:MAG: hypothetical protein ACPG4K_13780, partial [Haloferula sp.]
MRSPGLILALLLVACSAGNEGPPLHHPDLSLTNLALTAEGDSSLFKNYSVSGPVSWNQAWPWKLDLSGVAWDRANTATAITPRHVVMASHFIRAEGEAVVFHDRKGRRHERTMEKVIHFKERDARGDVAIGLLDRPLPVSIRSYPLPKPRTDYGESLTGAVVLITEQKRQLFFHQITSVNQSSIRFGFDKRVAKERRKHLIVGDSGHPSFLLSKGELVLIETHTTGGGGAGPFLGSSQNVAKVQELVEELDPAFTVRTVAIDGRALKEAQTGRTHLPQVPARKPAPPRTSATRTVPRNTQPGL